jgi:hypothetical protein
MISGIVRVLPDGTLVLSDELKETFADVQTFWAAQEGDFILLMPLEWEGSEALTAKQALDELRKMATQDGETTRTPEEVMEELRTVRRRIWKEEYRSRYIKAL